MRWDKVKAGVLNTLMWVCILTLVWHGLAPAEWC